MLISSKETNVVELVEVATFTRWPQLVRALHEANRWLTPVRVTVIRSSGQWTIHFYKVAAHASK